MVHLEPNILSWLQVDTFLLHSMALTCTQTDRMVGIAESRERVRTAKR